jgi:non-ribosomal peptide synthetase component F
MLLLAAFQTLLFRSSGQPRIRVGVPIANRNRLETERLIGFFVNTQVLQADLRGEDSFDLLAQVRQTTLAAQDHQDLPFEQLVDALQPERSLSYSPLFQVMFNHQAEHAGAAQAPRALAGLEVRSLGWSGDDAQFDLTLSTHESPGQLAASFTYATDLFEAASVQRLAGHWLGLLAQIVERPEAALGELRLLDSAEQARLASFNPAREAYESQLCIHQLIERQAAEAPQALALIDGERRLDHAWLQARANRLAHHLVAWGSARGAGGRGHAAQRRTAGGAAGGAQGRRHLCAAGPGLPARPPGLHARRQPGPRAADPGRGAGWRAAGRAGHGAGR